MILSPGAWDPGSDQLLRTTWPGPVASVHLPRYMPSVFTSACQGLLVSAQKC